MRVVLLLIYIFVIAGIVYGYHTDNLLYYGFISIAVMLYVIINILQDIYDELK